MTTREDPELDDALYAATLPGGASQAGSATWSASGRATPSDRQVARSRGIVARFLRGMADQCGDEMTIRELLARLGGTTDTDDPGDLT